MGQFIPSLSAVAKHQKYLKGSLMGRFCQPRQTLSGENKTPRLTREYLVRWARGEHLDVLSDAREYDNIRDASNSQSNKKKCQCSKEKSSCPNETRKM
jgi:hypothetical protein